MNILIGLIGIAFGFVLIWKTDWIVNNFGRVDWAEQHLGTEGGTRIFWKLIGLGIIVVAMLYMFGFWQSIIISTVGSIFPGSNLK